MPVSHDDQVSRPETPLPDGACHSRIGIQSRHPDATGGLPAPRLSHAKKLQRTSMDDPTVDTKAMISDILAVSQRYRDMQGSVAKSARSFATTLENATSDLFAFVNHPGMEPTNESERMLRPIVISRKIRYRLVNAVGASTFSTLLTCAMIWKRRNLNVSEMLYKALCGT